MTVVDDNDPLLGRVIDGRFTIQSVLGRGGMGVVYRAHQASLERSVALKVMSGVAPEREAEFQRRFFLEAATVAKLKHPNTITVFDYGSSDVEGQRIFFIAMELLDGQPLQKLLGKGRALAPLRAVHIAVQICRSLREAHKAGVVHRDLKPGNVMIVNQDDGDDVEGDFVKVLDFGLAKVGGAVDVMKPVEGITKAGTFMGSPRYVAPEQVEGRPVDARADVYSLGCILFRMLSGRVPFDGKQPVEIMLKHLHEPVPKMGVAAMPLSLERLVEDCLAKKASDRLPSMDAVLTRLKLARAELGGTGSGIMVVSDERSSLPPQPPVLELSEPPSDLVDPRDPPASSLGQATLVDRKTVSSRSSSSFSASSASSSLSEADVRDDARAAAFELRDDSTRPTRVLGQLTIKRKPQTPWAAIASGVLVGLLLCAAGVAWRLGFIDQWLARLTPVEAPATSTTSTTPAPKGPFAKHAKIRVKTDPPGADVLEVQDGLPRLLGTTPLVITWNLDEHAKSRELLLSKEGFKPSAASIAPPAQSPAEPVWLDVEAVLRRR